MVDRLAQYRRKRDFRRTPEPASGRRKPGQGQRLFVVQKHAARRLHYDFRLELGGVLKSWAVPKGPSLDPRVKRLAVHVEDHPLDYADFEGVIPEGEYGGGTVLVWDRGSWISLDDDPVRAYRNGALKFELRGRKLRGRWALVQMKGREGGKNWLLIKEHDGEEKPGSDDEIVATRPESVLSGRDLAAIAKARDRVWRSNRDRDGKSAPVAPSRPKRGRRRRTALDPSRIPGARRAPLPAKPAPQLATLAEHVPTGDDWLHEIKFDGYRLLARLSHGKVRLLSRNGEDWTHRFPGVAAALAALPAETALLDGEAVHLEASGLSSFAALKQDLSRGDTAGVTYHPFDLLHLDGYALDAARLDARKAALKALLESAPSAALRYSDHIAGQGSAFHAEACRLALEGCVSKRADAPYRAGRNSSWVKVKCQQREEFVIIGWTDPGRRRQGFGSLLLGYYDTAGALHFAGGVGTGFSDETLEAVRRRLDGLARRTPPSRAIAKAAPRRARWIEPVLVAELRFSEWTPDGRLRHPVFLGLREDKRAAKVVHDRAAVAASPAPSAPRRGIAEIAGVRLGRADKVLYPDIGLTKLDLARYCQRVAERMLAEIDGRPLTLVRCPDGLDGQRFFQKHASAGVPAELERLSVPEKGASATYLLARDPAALVALVQMGVLEIHIWGATAPDIERPDRVVFDLDPDEGLPWQRVAEAALEVRAFLEELGLASAPLATGGKGLHLVVPLKPRHGWDEIKAFTKSVAGELARRRPMAYTASLAKAARQQRIFIDYLRNQRGATAIAPYSTRARPGATVAAPLSWKEVERGIRSDAVTVATMPRRLAGAGKDPWRALAGLAQSLPAALRRRLRAA